MRKSTLKSNYFPRKKKHPPTCAKNRCANLNHSPSTRKSQIIRTPDDQRPLKIKKKLDRSDKAQRPRERSSIARANKGRGAVIFDEWRPKDTCRIIYTSTLLVLKSRSASAWANSIDLSPFHHVHSCDRDDDPRLDGSIIKGDKFRGSLLSMSSWLFNEPGDYCCWLISLLNR